VRTVPPELPAPPVTPVPVAVPVPPEIPPSPVVPPTPPLPPVLILPAPPPTTVAPPLGAVDPATAPAVPDAPARAPPLPAEPPFPPVTAAPPAPPPAGRAMLPPWPVVEPPEAPLLRPDDPWPHPIAEIRQTTPTPANDIGKGFDGSLVTAFPFVSGVPVPRQCFVGATSASGQRHPPDPHQPDLGRMRATGRADSERRSLLRAPLPGDCVATTEAIIHHNTLRPSV